MDGAKYEIDGANNEMDGTKYEIDGQNHERNEANYVKKVMYFVVYSRIKYCLRQIYVLKGMSSTLVLYGPLLTFQLHQCGSYTMVYF